MPRKHVVVLMGGMSSEHDVSMASGAKVAQSLDREKYRVTPVVIRKNGYWEFPGKGAVGICEALPELKRLKTDCVFIALHGPFGEDGRLQGALDLMGLPYTSSGCAGSALAMDKVRAKAVVRDAGLPVSPHVIVERKEWEADAGKAVARVTAQIGFPCVAKSPCQGSSLGMAIPRDAAELRAAAPGIFEFDDVIMVEAFIPGAELTCAVLDADSGTAPKALPVTEIRPVTAAFFDYHAKYTPGATQEITPAEIPPELAARVQEIAVRAHRLVGCSIWSRSDFIVGADGPVWIEINTIPGMTPTSLYPQAAAAVGIPYGTLMGIFVEAAIARRRRPQKGR